MTYERVSHTRPCVCLVLALVVVLAAAPTSLAQNESAGPIELFQAVRSGDVAALRALVAEGADVNTPDDQGRNLLGFAAVQGDVDMTRLLLKAGAEVNARSDPGGWTALLVATTSNQPAVARTLIQAGADVELTTADGWSPLRMATRDGLVELVDVLLEAGADPERRDAGGVTPFMIAAHFGHAETARLLTPAGFHYATDGALMHTYSGARFDPTVAGYARGTPVAFDEEGTNVGVTYRKPIDRASRIEATVYVYPAGAGNVDREQIREHFQQCKNDIAAQHESVHELLEHEYMWEELPGGRRFTAMGMYRLGNGPNAYVSYLFLLGKNEWFIKYRMTYPASAHEVEGVAAFVPELAASFDYEMME